MDGLRWLHEQKAHSQSLKDNFQNQAIMLVERDNQGSQQVYEYRHGFEVKLQLNEVAESWHHFSCQILLIPTQESTPNVL